MLYEVLVLGDVHSVCYVVFFFFKQKTAYEMRISDWSSDVCSSDLHSIDIALDGEEWSCLARLNYGGGSDGEAIFLPFEIESFALLWNASAEQIHGVDAQQITMHFKNGSTRYPFTASAGVN